MTNEQEKLQELEQRVIALTADKNELQKLNSSLNQQVEDLENANEQLALELRLVNLKIPTHLPKVNPFTKKNDQEKTILIIFLLIVLAGALLFK